MNSDLTEHAPLSALDERPLHQSLEPVRFVATTDPRAFERYWFTAQDETGEFFIVTGMGQYPNLGKTDAYALIVHQDRQTTVRAWQQLGVDRSELEVGPIRFDPVAPFKEWHLRLAPNAQEFEFDLRWRDTKRAVFQRFQVPGSMPGVMNTRLIHDWAGYETFGRIEGTLTYMGKKILIDPTTTRGSRDHHWGVRDGVGGAGHALSESHRSHLGQWVEFEDWAIWGTQILHPIGAAQPGAIPVQMLEAKLRFDPDTNHLIGGIVTNRLRNGDIREIFYEQIGNAVAYLRAGMYTGCNDLGTPEEDYHHGSIPGEGVGGETYNLADPLERKRIAGFENHVMRATCNGETTVGILECRNPSIHDMAQRNIQYSILRA